LNRNYCYPPVPQPEWSSLHPLNLFIGFLQVIYYVRGCFSKQKKFNELTHHSLNTGYRHDFSRTTTNISYSNEIHKNNRLSILYYYLPKTLIKLTICHA